MELRIEEITTSTDVQEKSKNGIITTSLTPSLVPLTSIKNSDPHRSEKIH